ncbi:lectin-like domain-containing protein, partial [Fructobacillus evanidus]|uniref:lectin-like domain-containing protein n=1 Tax=Fructobacillus evanidus TaxID=3064281 RepID=UPI0030C85121
MKRNIISRANKVTKNFKMYKSGKMWIFASTFFLVGLAPIVVSSQSIGFPDTQVVASAAEVGYRTVDPSQFNHYFSYYGDATFLNKNNIYQLTPSAKSQVGSVSLKTKIDMSQSFVFSGQIYLGGGDGVAFGFADAGIGQLGDQGNSFGIGNLSNAFGIKLDTYNNSTPNGSALADASSKPNMDFIYTDSYGQVHSDNKNYTNITGISPNWSDLEVTYDGNTKILSMNAQGQKLSVNVSKYIKNNSLTMFLVGSTGESYGANQFKFNSFQYTIATDSNGNNGIDNNGTNNTGDNNTGNSNAGSNNSGDNNTGNSNAGSNNSGDNNTGNSNTGSNNSGDNNTGNSNAGSNNSGDNNTGNSNTGLNNSGDNNTGNSNAGSNNSGDNNTGNSNAGSNNSGDNNTGNSNAGSNNSGNDNHGNNNHGDNNTGNSNAGSNNSGDNNTGNSNAGSNNSGDNNTGNSNTGLNNSGDNNTGNSN